MIKIFQKRWLDIEFDSFAELNTNQLADSQFYRTFYQVLFEKYPRYETLPLNYTASKQATAKMLATFIQDMKATSVLSIGCGNGIIENELKLTLPHLELTVYEPCMENLRWLKAIPHLCYYHGALKPCLKAKKYDLIYLNCVDYALTNTAYRTLLAAIQETKTPVLLTEIIKPYPSAAAFLKYWIKFALYKMRVYNPGQLWGYLRHFKEHRAIFTQAGYRTGRKGNLSKELYWIELIPRETDT